MQGDKVSVDITVSGRVQGVGYRFFTESLAARLGVNGWSMNMPDGSVTAEVEGDREAVEKFVAELKDGPRAARVAEVSVTWKPYQGRYNNFIIRF